MGPLEGLVERSEMSKSSIDCSATRLTSASLSIRLEVSTAPLPTLAQAPSADLRRLLDSATALTVSSLTTAQPPDACLLSNTLLEAASSQLSSLAASATLHQGKLLLEPAAHAPPSHLLRCNILESSGKELSSDHLTALVCQPLRLQNTLLDGSPEALKTKATPARRELGKRTRPAPSPHLEKKARAESLGAPAEEELDWAGWAAEMATAEAEAEEEWAMEAGEEGDSEEARAPEAEAKAALLRSLCGALLGAGGAEELERAAWAVAEGPEPEFILKAALYAREELNLRQPANALLAVAARSPAARPFLRKYFAAAVRLPSDWCEVPQLLNGAPIPTALRKVMVAKFPDFDEYQLAKHNKAKKVKKPKKGGKEDGDQVKPTKTSSDGSSAKLNLKRLIRRLHIDRPAKLVMGIVGKKYPESADAFARSGLLGVWEEERAGKRMKLATPVTWETQVSARGNKAAVWEALLDQKKLPFMAMLRNLRNLIKAGISMAHHDGVLKRLSDERQVAGSRQLPFRFYSAFAVLDQLEEWFKKKVEEAAKPPAVSAKRHRGRKLPQQKGKGRRKKETGGDVNYDPVLLQRYRKALETAVELSVRRNVPLLAGRVVVVLAPSALSSAVPENLRRSAVLLALMGRAAAEDPVLLVPGGSGLVPFAPPAHLARSRNILALMTALQDSVPLDLSYTAAQLAASLDAYTRQRKKVSKLLVLGGGGSGALAEAEERAVSCFAARHRSLLNPALLRLSVSLRSGGARLTSASPLDVSLAGFSDKVLQFLAESGGRAQTARVDAIDVARGLVGPPVQPPLTKEAFERLRAALCPSVLPSSKPPLRLFVSSTFTDMDSERNLLVRHLLPALNRRAHCRPVVPVDLRWGVGEAALEQCLREAGRSEALLLLVGHRRGSVPTSSELRDLAGLAGLEWLEELAGEGLSVTELELEAFQRSPHCPKAKPLVFRRQKLDWPDHVEEGRRALVEDADARSARRLDAFRQRLPEPIEYSGSVSEVRNGKLVLSQLEDFAARLTEELTRLTAASQGIDQVSVGVWAAQQTFLRSIADQRLFTSQHYDSLRRETNKARLVVLRGEAGAGKTFFLAQLAEELARDEKTLVVPLFKDACEGNAGWEGLGRGLCSLVSLAGCRLAGRKEATREALEWLGSLRERVVLVVDGWEEADASVVLEGVGGLCVVVGCRRGGRTERAAEAKARVELGPLSLAERKALVRAELGRRGKRLADGAWANQLRLLTGKRDAGRADFLSLAFQLLLRDADFHSLPAHIRALPSTLAALLTFFVRSLQRSPFAASATAALHLVLASPIPLRESELSSLLDDSSAALGTRESLGALAALSPVLCGDSAGFLRPRFAHLRQALLAALPKTGRPDARRLSGFLLSSLLSGKGGVKPTAEGRHLRGLLALARPQDLLRVATDQGFLRHLLADRGLQADFAVALRDIQASSDVSAEDKDRLLSVSRFVSSRSAFLRRYPQALAQELSSLPREHPLWRAAPDESGPLVPILSDTAVEDWTIGEQKLSTFRLTALTELGNDSKAVGDERGRIVVVDAGGRVGRILWSRGSGVTCLSRVSETLLASGHADGSLDLWSAESGLREGQLKGHSDRVTFVLRSGDGEAVSGSRDGTVRFWKLKGCEELRFIKTGSPVSWGALDSERSGGGAVATGHWDGAVRLYSVVSYERLATMRSGSGAVRAVAFVESGAQLLSASLAGDLRLWDARLGVQVGVFPGHSAPIRALTVQGSAFASQDEDGRLLCWRTQLGERITRLPATEAVKACAVSPSGEWLALGSSDGFVAMFRLRSGEVEEGWRKEAGLVRALSFMSERRLLVCCESGLNVLSTEAGSEEASLADEAGRGFRCVASTEEAGVVGCADGSLGAFDLAGLFTSSIGSLSFVTGSHEGPVAAVSISASRRLASVGPDSKLRICPLSSLFTQNSSTKDLAIEVPGAGLSAVAWLGISDNVVVGKEDGTVEVWDAEKHTLTQKLDWHSSGIASLSSEAVSGSLVSVGVDGTCVLSTEKGALVWRRQLGPGTVAALRLPASGTDWAAEVEAELAGDRGRPAKPSLRQALLLTSTANGDTSLWSPFTQRPFAHTSLGANDTLLSSVQHEAGISLQVGSGSGELRTLEPSLPESTTAAPEAPLVAVLPERQGLSVTLDDAGRLELRREEHCARREVCPSGEAVGLAWSDSSEATFVSVAEGEVRGWAVGEGPGLELAETWRVGRSKLGLGPEEALLGVGETGGEGVALLSWWGSVLWLSGSNGRLLRRLDLPPATPATRIVASHHSDKTRVLAPGWDGGLETGMVLKKAYNLAVFLGPQLFCATLTGEVHQVDLDDDSNVECTTKVEEGELMCLEGLGQLSLVTLGSTSGLVKLWRLASSGLRLVSRGDASRG